MHTPHVPRADDGPTMRPPGRNTGRAGPLTFPWIWPAALAVILLVALAVRFGLVLEGRELVQSLSQVLDARYYVEAARAIASGEGLPPKPFFMSPGYIGFVALFARAFGDPIIPLIITQILIDGVTCLLTSVLAASLFGRPAGFLAGLLLALHGPMILASSRVLPETLVVFFLVLLALALTHLDKRAARGTSAVAGLLLGLICLLRSNAILFLPILLTSLALRGRGGGRRAALTSSAAVLAGFLAVILPVTLFNAIVGRDFVLISTNGGVNFYIGNATEGDGRMMSLNSLPLAPGQFQDNPAGGLFEQSVHDFAERKIGRLLRPSEASAFWWRQGMVEIERSPTLWAKLVLRKAFLLVNGFEVPQVENIYFTERYLSLPRGSLSFTSRLLWPLALAGSVLLIRRRRISRDLLLLSAAYAVSLLIFFVTWRHRLPLLPLVACFAAFAAVRCVELARLQSKRPLLRALALLTLTGIICNLSPALGRTGYQGGWFDVPEDYLDFTNQHSNLGNALAAQGRPEEAIAHYREAIRLKGNYSEAHNNLGAALAAQGNLDEAIAQYREAIRLQGNYSDAYYNLGAALAAQGKFDEAMAHYREAIRLDDNNSEAHNNLGAALIQTGRFEEAIPELRRALELDPHYAAAEHNLALALRRSGRLDQVVSENPRHAGTSRAP
jgi:tetratricopeptide (TPR) repeat protein